MNNETEHQPVSPSLEALIDFFVVGKFEPSRKYYEIFKFGYNLALMDIKNKVQPEGKTAIEILEQYNIMTNYNGAMQRYEYKAEDALKAMEEYAQQYKPTSEDAVGFMNWTLGGDCPFSCVDEDEWNPEPYDWDNRTTYTTQEVFEKYLEYKKTTNG